MRIAALIPARGGSKSLKLKNIQSLNGRPLIYYSIKSAAEICDDVFISSDDKNILAVANDFKCKTILRPSEYSGDTASTEIVLKHGANKIQFVNKYDAVLYLSACEPLRPKGTIKKLLNKYLKKKETIDSLFFGRPTHRHYWSLNPKLSSRPIMEWMDKYTPRQNSKQRLLLESTGYGLLTLPKYWSEGKRFGGRCDWLEIPENIPEVDIHSRIDIDLIEALTKINPKLLP